MKRLSPAQTLLQLPLQRLWWRGLRAAYKPTVVTQGSLAVEVMDARSRAVRREAPALELVEGALRRLAQAGQGFGELTTEHVRLIALMDVSTDFALPHLRTYVSPLSTGSRHSAHMMACQLVWAATVIRLSRDRLHFGRDVNDAETDRAAKGAQRRFLQQFEDWEPWVAALRLG